MLALLEHARAIKLGRARARLAGKVATLLFFNPSVRTRVSCEAAMARFGGAGITVNPGKDTWNFECGEGVVMDQNTQEHVRELAPVLARMGHLVGIRKSELITVGLDKAAVSGDYTTLARDEFLHQFARFSDVPVVNIESNRWHPLQGLADALTIDRKSVV